MAKGHARCAPERDDKSKIEWMTHHLVKSRRLEWNWSFVLTPEVVVNLLESEEGEVIDQVSRNQNTSPANPKYGLQECAAGWVSYFPYDGAHRLPLPEKQQQHEARD